MEKVIFLVANLDAYNKDENGTRIAHSFERNFGIENHLLDNFRKYIKKYDNFLFVASSFDAEATDAHASATIESFKQTLPFKNYDVLDMRTKDKAKQLVKNADFIFISGGHVPTQNQLFQKLNLARLIQNTNAVICGQSAGSMNLAKVVYCPPELDGEAVDPNFKKYFKGLGLVDINIYPHHTPSTLKQEYVDGVNLMEDAIADSFNRPIFMFDNGNYFLQVNGRASLFGECYYIRNGVISKMVGLEKFKTTN